jgi:excinuclease UvrABC nuclease subunit
MAYHSTARLAQRFLSGQSDGPLARLEQEMVSASNSQEFERAAALRDKWETLKWIQKQLERMRMAREKLSFVYSVAGEGGRNLWYLIHQGYVAGVIPTPHDREAKRAAADVIEILYHSKKARFFLPGPEAIDQVLLVAAWFHRHPAERSRTIEPSKLIDRCRARHSAA